MSPRTGGGGPQTPEPQRRRSSVAGRRSASRRALDARAGGTAAPATATATTAGPVPRWATRQVAMGLAIAVAVTAVLAAFLAYRVRQAALAEEARSEAPAAARQYAPLILSFDYRHLDQDFAAGRRHLTEEFAKDYAETTEKAVKPTALQYQYVVRTEVAVASVVAAEAGRADLLLYINTTTTGARLKAPRIDQARVRMTLVERDGEWLISKINPF